MQMLLSFFSRHVVNLLAQTGFEQTPRTDVSLVQTSLPGSGQQWCVVLLWFGHEAPQRFVSV